jgi:hypothetical protein
MYRQYKYTLNNKINAFFSEPFDCGHSLGTGYYKNKKYFLLVSKNASTTVRTILTEKNWSYHNNIRGLDIEKFYVILRDPLERWYSGVIEFLVNGVSNNKNNSLFDLFKDEYFIKMLVEVGIFDGHTVPQSWYISNLIYSKILFYKFDNAVVDRILTHLDEECIYKNHKKSIELPLQGELIEILKQAIKKLDLENRIKKHYIENDYILINSVKNWL